MATWADVLGYLRANFSPVQDTGDRLELFCSSKHVGAQVMIVEHRTVAAFPAESWVTIASPVAAAGYADANAVLNRAGGRHVVGGFVRVGESIFLHHAVPISTMRLHEFVVPFHLILDTAGELVREFMPERRWP